MKILFWLLISADAAVLALFFVLGLAAATSTRQSGVSVAFAPPFLVPALILVLAIVLFTRSSSTLLRSVALLMAAAPALILVVTQRVSSFTLKQNMNSAGELTSFHEGPMREIADAIRSNDTATVSRLVSGVDVNARGYMDMTLLMLALRQLEKNPTDLTNLRTLLNAKANPNLASGGELPLSVAIQQSEHAGAEPTTLLLKAGANPNTLDQFGTPLFFAGTYRTAPPAVMATLLEHGADITVKDKNGLSIVFDAAQTNNWKAALVLLERGVDYKNGRTVNGESFTQMVESHARVYGDTAGVAEVLAYLRKH